MSVLLVKSLPTRQHGQGPVQKMSDFTTQKLLEDIAGNFKPNLLGSMANLSRHPTNLKGNHKKCDLATMGLNATNIEINCV